MVGYHNAVATWLGSLQDHVAPDLVNPVIPPSPTEMADQFLAIQIPRQLHPTAISSSRLRCNLTAEGFSSSKK